MSYELLTASRKYFNAAVKYATKYKLLLN